jgi:membrane protease YdiL (CAAX protease family)
VFGPQSDPARVAGLTWLAVAMLMTGFLRIHVSVPVIGDVGSTLVAALFLYAPIFVARRRGENLDDYGFHAAPVKRGLGIAVAAIAVIVPLFALGYYAFHDVACNSTSLAHLVPRGMCAHYGGLASVHPPALTRELAVSSLGQVITVALPEELFFRGFLLKLLEDKWPPKRRILGGGVGLALVVSAAAFALIHLPKAGDPRVLATFVPALLFGWMRSATGSILASTVTHGASNILIGLLDLTVTG